MKINNQFSRFISDIIFNSSILTSYAVSCGSNVNCVALRVYSTGNLDNLLLKGYQSGVIQEVARIQNSAGVPTFDMLAGRLTGDFDCGYKVFNNQKFQLGTYILAKSVTVKTEDTTTYYLKKQFSIDNYANAQIAIEAKSGDITKTVKIGVSRNAAAIESELSYNSVDYTTQQVVMYDLIPGDQILIWGRIVTAGGLCTLREVDVMCNIMPNVSIALE